MPSELLSFDPATNTKLGKHHSVSSSVKGAVLGESIIE